MRITILAFGKGADSEEGRIAARYLQRLRPPATIVEIARPPLPQAPPGAVTVALDERGDALASEAIAARLGRWRDGGARELRFLIGPADGLSAATLAAADARWAFGPQTWPHLLVRAMLAEQLYRAMTILDGHPYHRN